MKPPKSHFWRSRPQGAPAHPPGWRRPRRHLGAAAAAATVFALVLSSGTSAVAAPAPPPVASPQVAPALDALQDVGASLPVTLITGDTVYVSMSADGNPVVREIEAAPGREDAFHTYTRNDSVYVIPDDALGLLGEGLLDWELFNIAKLGAHVLNGTVGEIPVIVTHSGKPPARIAGAAAERQLSSVNGTAMTVDADGQWWQQVHADTATVGRAGELGGVKKVWLNELLRINLDESVPQVGASVAWDRGYDGSGVTVAVLDTGIDATHPDVAGKVVDQWDFIQNDDEAQDGNGHGTHVAATVAGTGAASDGQRPGVAPGADLMMGRVCDAGGSCPSDAIIAGMEWAAASDAQVVNMSLGGGATDGTDPLSQTLNQLSRQHDTLFVTSAGNAGPAPGTVGAPAVADEALAVAAVDKQDQMAPFSSRGPRLDGVPKPDIAAPGVGIVAARAAGTSMGTPVDDFYTSANGTSMASPHVAGAAAIAAQQSPELTGAELKRLLMASARDLGHDQYAQGAGRLDLAQAVDGAVFDSGNLNFGQLEYPHGDVLTRPLTYLNLTEEPITLNLEASLEFNDGTPAPGGMLSLNTDQVSLAGGESVEVEVTLDTGALGDGPLGRYRGEVNATDDAGVLRTSSPVAAFLEPERHQVTIEIPPPADAGKAAVGDVVIVPMDDQVNLHDDPQIVPGGETVTAGLFAGTYSVAVTVKWAEEGKVGSNWARLAEPEVTVEDGPTSVRLDVNEARPLRTEPPDESFASREVLYLDRVSATGAWSWSSAIGSSYEASWEDMWVLPSEPVSEGTFIYRSDHILVPATVGMRIAGGGRPFEVAPRYGTLDVSALGAIQRLPNDRGGVDQRRSVLPVTEIAGQRPLPVVDGGAGTPEDLAGVDADGALVLMRPLDLVLDNRDANVLGGWWYGPIITNGLAWDRLQERVGAAAEAGAVGVIVASDRGEHLAFDGPHPGSVDCPEGPGSCPTAEPYLPLPAVTVGAAAADKLVDRLARTDKVRVTMNGDREVSEVYGYVFTDDQVPAGLPHELDEVDMQRVDHHIHADRPGETAICVQASCGFSWTRVVPGSELPPPHIRPYGAALPNPLPRVASQRSVTVYVNEAPDAVDQFSVYPADYVDSSALREPQVEPHTSFGNILPAETVELVLEDEQELHWNAGPTIPTAASRAVTASGFEAEPTVFCAGCRTGNTLVPAMYTGSSPGPRSRIVGLVNDVGVAALGFYTLACEPPRCEVRMWDADGNELEQRLQRVTGSVGLPSGSTLPIPTGGVAAPDLSSGVNSSLGDGLTGEEIYR